MPSWFPFTDDSTRRITRRRARGRHRCRRARSPARRCRRAALPVRAQHGPPRQRPPPAPRPRPARREPCAQPCRRRPLLRHVASATSSLTPPAAARRPSPASAATRTPAASARRWRGSTAAVAAPPRSCGCGWDRRRIAPCCSDPASAASGSRAAGARAGQLQAVGRDGRLRLAPLSALRPTGASPRGTPAVANGPASRWLGAREVRSAPLCAAAESRLAFVHMRALPDRLAARFLPQGWPDLFRQILLFCGAYWLYRIVRGMTDGRVADGVRQRARRDRPRAGAGAVHRAGRARVGREHRLGDRRRELGVRQLPLHDHLDHARLLYLRRNASFYFVRNMFMVAMGIALVGYAAYPTAPPRFMPEWGFADSVARFTGLTSRQGSSADALFNPFAAVPVDARRVRADARRADGVDDRAALGQGALARLPAARQLRRRRDRQPLVARRLPRRGSPPPSRRWSRARARALASGGLGMGARPLRRPPRAGRSSIPRAYMPSPPLDRARRRDGARHTQTLAAQPARSTRA